MKAVTYRIIPGVFFNAKLCFHLQSEERDVKLFTDEVLSALNELVETNYSEILHEQEELWTFVGYTDGGDASYTLDFLRFCNATVEMNLTFGDWKLQTNGSYGNSSRGTYGLQLAFNYPWSNNSPSADCHIQFTEFKNQFKIHHFSKSKDMYVEHLSDLKNAIKAKYFRKPCSENYRNRIQSYLDTSDLCINIMLSDSITDALSYAEGFLPLTDKFTVSQDVFDNFTTHCLLTQQELSEKEQFVYKIMDYYVSANLKFREIFWYFNLYSQIGQLYVDLLDWVIPTLYGIDDYLDRNISKLQLSNEFLSGSFKKATERSSFQNKELKDFMLLYSKDFLLLSFQYGFIEANYEYDYRMDEGDIQALLPHILLPTFVEKYGFDEELLNHQNNFFDLFSLLYTIWLDVDEDTTDHITKPIDELLEDISILSDNLEEYRKSTEMNADFYL